MTNFDFLKENYQNYYKLSVLAEQYYKSDPPTSIGKLRLLAEYIVKEIYTSYERLDPLKTFNDLIKECHQKDYIPDKIVSLLHTVRIKGNAAAHEHRGNSDEALDLLKYAHFITFWFYVLNGGDSNTFKSFVKPASKFEELKKLKEEQDNVILELKKKLEESQELLKLKPKTEAEVINFKKKSEEISNYKQIELSEKQTRKIFIDTKLKRAGWNLINNRNNLDLKTLDNTIIKEFPTSSGPADYALFVKGQLLGFLEAKKLKTGSQNVLEQAKRYSKTAYEGPGNWRDYKVPFLYASNGEIIHFLDVRQKKSISRELSEFHTSSALNEFFKREEFDSAKWFKENPINDYFTGTLKKPHPFQKIAIQKVEEGVIDSKRKMLLAMATGTGKTFTTISLIYRLLESKAVKRVLFLVDRRALAAQAVTAFNAFETPKGGKFTTEYEVYSQKFQKEDLDPDEKYDINVLPNEYLTDPQPKHTFVYVSTIQRMTSNIEGKEVQGISDEEGNQEYEFEANKLDIPIHTFDLIIIDECHRGYTSKESNIWRDTIKYFDAIKLGLTATPAMHTVGYFNEPIYKYSIEEAVLDGFLVDQTDPVIIRSGMKIKGVFLKEGEQIELIDTETGKSNIDFLEDERDFPPSDIEKKVTSPDSNKKIIKELKKYLDEHIEKTGRFPKTLIFAANDLPHTSHSDEIVRICKETFNQGDDFVVKITGSTSVDRPLQKIREFRNRKEPKIVVTVDMLTTGVDIPEIEFLVFLRSVQSRILWEQMLGRATRTCDDIKKTGYTVVDCFEGTLIERFEKASNFDYKQPQKESLSVSEVIDKIYKNEDRQYFTKALKRRLRLIEKNMSGEAYDLFAPYIEEGDIGKFADELIDKIDHEFPKTMRVLRDTDFQELLIKYPRAKRSFIRATDAEDEVTSERLIKYGLKSLKPNDYLEEFCKFIKENPEQVEAIKIILERPKEWSTDVLKELREELIKNKFNIKGLQKAHKFIHNKALADIISMVKKAAIEEALLLTAEERVNSAMVKVTEGRSFTKEQQNWLELIRVHLIENLSIDLEDFEFMPVFTDRGGLSRARSLFKEELEKLIDEINSNIAA